MTDKPLRKKLTQRGEKVTPADNKETKSKSTEVKKDADK